MNFDIFPDRYKEKCRKWDRAKIEDHFGTVPEEFVPMWIADMDFKAPDILLKRLSDAVDIGVFGYTYVYDEFFDAVSHYYERHCKTEISKEEVTLCYGTVGTLHYTVQAFCEKNGTDTAMIQTPVYDPFHRAITAHGVTCIENPLVIRDNRYEIDFEDFETKLKEHRPKLFMLCNPHNPSGRIWSQEELVKMISLCKKYGAVVVSDEVHGGMIYQGTYTSVCQLADCMEQVILLSSPNKKYNIGGLKTSYAIIKNPALREVFRNQLSKNSVTSPSVFGIIAFNACMEEGEEWSEACMKYVYNNYQYAINYIKQELPGISYMEMESSYLLWMDIHGTGISSDVFTKELAQNYGVLVESGNNFVNNGEGFIRINLGTQKKNVIQCFQRIKEYLAKR